MRLETFSDAHSAARAAATFIARAIREAVAQRGQCVLACSGGSGPWHMFRCLAIEAVPWQRVHVVQVDERVVPLAHDERNWKHLREHFIGPVQLPASHAHPMPVDEEDLWAAAETYAQNLSAIAGRPAILDVVHLGLGADGHTASLVPDDPVLDVENCDVSVTQPYHGYRRMTLTYAALNRARCLLWLITGQAKADALARLLKRDRSVPAGRVNPANAVVFTGG